MAVEDHTSLGGNQQALVFEGQHLSSGYNINTCSCKLFEAVMCFFDGLTVPFFIRKVWVCKIQMQFV
jgi:hypothetical protein